MKKSWLKWGLFCLLLAGLIHGLVLYFIPRIIMEVVAYRITRQVGVNSFLHAPVPEAGNDFIMRMSPDILYSASVYDVSEHPLRYRFQTPEQGTYWSVSLYDARNSANVFALSDMRVKTDLDKEVVLVVKPKGSAYRAGLQEVVVEAEYPRGILLKRIIVENRYRQEEIRCLVEIQKQAVVEVVKE